MTIEDMHSGLGEGQNLATRVSGRQIFEKYELDLQALLDLIHDGLIPLTPPPGFYPFFVYDLNKEYASSNYIEGRVPLAPGERLEPQKDSLKDISNLGRFSLNPESGHWQLLFHENLKKILGHKNWDYSIEFELHGKEDPTIHYGSFHINFELVDEWYQVWAEYEGKCYWAVNEDALKNIKHAFSQWFVFRNQTAQQATASPQQEKRTTLQVLNEELERQAAFKKKSFLIQPPNSVSVEELSFYQLATILLTGSPMLAKFVDNKKFKSYLNTILSELMSFLSGMYFKKERLHALLEARVCEELKDLDRKVQMDWRDVLSDDQLLHDVIADWKTLASNGDLTDNQKYAAQAAIQKWNGKSHAEAYKRLEPPLEGEEKSFMKRMKQEAEKLAKKNSITMPPWRATEYSKYMRTKKK